MAITTNNNNEIGGKITQALGAGSGVDIHNLATTLAETETMPRINSVTEKKAESTVAISGYGVLKASVSSLKASFEKLKNPGSLLDKTVSTSHTTRLEAKITTAANAQPGTHIIRVVELAKPQQNRVKDNGTNFTALDQSLSGSNFTITIKVPHDAASGTDVVVSDHTPQGIINAVNSVTSTTGVSARALSTGTSSANFGIFLTGKTGVNNSFDFTSTLSGDSALSGGGHGNKTQTATDLNVTLNGLANVKKESNTPKDLIDGLELDFKREGSSTDLTVTVGQSTQSLEDSLNTMIDSYNNVIQLSNYLTGDKSEDDELAGSLASEKGTVNLIKSRIRGIISQSSESASNGLTTLRDLGITTKLGGEIALNATTYAAAVKDKLSDIQTMLTNNLTDQDKSDTRDHGLALDITTVLDNITNDQGTITTKETNVTAEVARYEKELTDLQERLETIKQRYLRQFVAMESLVQRNKSTGEYLTGQFKAMENMYSSK